jgi:hypothetical protein
MPTKLVGRAIRRHIDAVINATSRSTTTGNHCWRMGRRRCRKGVGMGGKAFIYLVRIGDPSTIHTYSILVNLASVNTLKTVSFSK